jgi:hypothetical protein
VSSIDLERNTIVRNHPLGDRAIENSRDRGFSREAPPRFCIGIPKFLARIVDAYVDHPALVGVLLDFERMLKSQMDFSPSRVLDLLVSRRPKE